jgi:hypothetical protein
MIEVYGPWNQVGIGNHFFMYSYLRQISEKLNLKLETSKISFSERNGTQPTKEYKFKTIKGLDFTKNKPFYIDDGFSCSLQTVDKAVEFLKENNHLHIISSGYYQKYSYWKQNKDVVKSYFKNFTNKKRFGPNSVAVHLRKSNQDPNISLPDDYYLRSLDEMNCKNVYLFADNFNRHYNLINILNQNKKYKVKLMDLNVQNSIKKITSFDNIICSQGSFSFWVSFLSSASNIFWPIPQVGPNKIENNWSLDYTVDDEDRYKFIKLP